MEPVDQISDNKAENYDFKISLAELEPSAAPAAPAKGKKATPLLSSPVQTDHVIVVRAYDRFDNMGTAKTLIRVR